MSIETLAAVCHGADRPFALETVLIDSPREDEVLVRVTATGVCHMDLEGKEMLTTPSVLGHEGVGIVEAVGARVSKVKPGDRVIMSYAWCGSCPNCEQNQPYHCDRSWDVTFTGVRLDGSHTIFQGGNAVSACFFQQSSFAKHALCSERNIVVVQSGLPDTLLASLPCGILTGAGVVQQQFGLKPDNSLVVFGVGAVGLSAVMTAHRLGAGPIIAVDLNDQRLALASELGATHTLNAGDGDVVERIETICGRGAEFSVDTTGNARAFDDAVQCLTTGGRMAACILPAPMESFTYKLFPFFVRAASLEAVSFGRAVASELIPQLIAWHEAGEFPVDRLIGVYDFADINQACEDSKSGKTIKPVLRMQHDE